MSSSDEASKKDVAREGEAVAVRIDATAEDRSENVKEDDDDDGDDNVLIAH